jgi:hypothetical protein
MKPGTFRSWLERKWQEHIDEVDMFEGTMPNYSKKCYFNKYKYWLVREFKHEIGR